MNLDKVKKIYMIGIKGVGMTMLAQFLCEKDYEISGSDVSDKFMTDEVLEKCDIKVIEGFDEKNIPNDADLIIYSSAYNEKTNVEVASATKGKIKILTYAEVLSVLFSSMRGIAVCGSHGKTTTTAWLGYVLMKAGKEPNVLVGSNVPQFKGASISGKSNNLIIEADEYQNKLKHYDPKIVLLNNIDYDHPDYFKTKEDYKKVFIDFIKRIPKNGFLVANYDDKIIRSIADVNSLARVISYAIDETADYIAYDIKQVGDKQYFKVKLGVDFDEDELASVTDNFLGDFSIKLSGKHNILNALAVIATSVELGVELVDIRSGLEDFEGTSRRMEIMGKYRGATIVDDYAHHPTEIKTTLAGARSTYPDNFLRVVFHPHTFTRTKAMLKEFAESFSEADELIVLDIYGSAREEQGGVHTNDLIALIENKNVKYIPTLGECEKYLRDNVERDDIILLMGAGDVFRIGENLVK